MNKLDSGQNFALSGLNTETFLIILCCIARCVKFFLPHNQSPSKICKHPPIQIDIAIKFIMKSNTITLEPGIDILIPTLPLPPFFNLLKNDQPSYLIICFAPK